MTHYPELDLLLAETEKLAVPGPNVEVQTAARFEALLQHYPSSEAIQDIYDVTASNMVRRQISVMAAMSGLRNSLVHYDVLTAAERGEEYVDAHLTTADSYHRSIDALERDLSLPSAQQSKAASFLMNMGLVFLDACTPVMPRQYPLDIYSQLVSERYPEGARVLDYGSSIMLGAMAIMHKDKIQPPTFASVTSRDPLTKQTADLTHTANDILLRPNPIREIVCVDRFPVYYEGYGYDIPYRDYALSGLRPSERNDPKYMRDVRALMAIKQASAKTKDIDSGVTFQCCDFLDPKSHDLRYFRQVFPGDFDIITVNFVTQELTPWQQPLLHGILVNMLSEKGLLIYNHQAYLDPTATPPVQFDAVTPYTSYAAKTWISQSHVLDKLQPEAGLQHMATFYDNRCRDVRLAAGKLAVSGSPVPIADLLRDL